MLRHTTLFAVLATLLLSLVPAFTSAQPPPPPPSGPRTPDRILHGWAPYDFAPSPNPKSANLIYVIDGQRDVLLVDAFSGNAVRNFSYVAFDTSYYLDDIAVDSRGYVLVTTYSYYRGFNGLLVLDDQLNLLTNVSFAALKPAADTWDMQVVVDSTNTVYLFDGEYWSDTRGQVWVLSARQWAQQATFKAPVSLANYTGYVIAIDNQDYLYFQGTSGYKQLYVTDNSGTVQATFTMGTGNMSDPWIDDVVIDAQLQMWHTHEYNSYISVSDSNANLLAVYDILSDDTYYNYRTNHIAVDANNNVWATDTVESALLLVSQRGDIAYTVASPIQPMWYANELLGDYVGGGRGAGSLLINDYYSPYAAQRLSADERDAGTLLQRYPLPSRLDGPCRSIAMDVGQRSGNIYLLLYCRYSRTEEYGLVYVVSQANRVVSEFRVDSDAVRVRVDELASALYVAVEGYWNGRDTMVMAYSTLDGSQTLNFTTTSPRIQYVSDMTILPASQGNAAQLVVVDTFNNRFVNFDTSAPENVDIFAFDDGVYYYDVTFSFFGRRALFYASGAQLRPNSTNYQVDTFVRKYDSSDPSNPPTLLATFVPPPGRDAYFTAIVTGLDGHLYAFCADSGSLYRWNDGDREHADELQQAGEPRVYVGEVVGGATVAQAADVAEVAATPRSSALNRHSRMRGVTAQ